MVSYEIIKAINISLILNKHHAFSLNKYQSISLCNTFHKIIAKILANHMKFVFPNNIYLAQSSFISCRLSIDNIIFTNEILHELGASSLGKIFMLSLM